MKQLKLKLEIAEKIKQFKTFQSISKNEASLLLQKNSDQTVVKLDLVNTIYNDIANNQFEPDKSSIHIKNDKLVKGQEILLAFLQTDKEILNTFVEVEQ